MSSRPNRVSRRARRRLLTPYGVAVALGAAVLLLLAGCGSSGSGTKTAADTPIKIVPGAKGGALTFLSASDVDSLDPGISDYSVGFMVLQATQRTLYAFKPDNPTQLVPDLATGMPEISADNKTVTVHIKSGIRFAPPVNRAVTSADVKYAMERVFTKQVPSSYAATYFGSLVGAPAKPNSGDLKPISGIVTPDAHTLVFHLSKPRGGLFASTLIKGATAPVPQEYAKQFDAQNPSTYSQHAVATGAYTVANDASGKLTGWTPGKQIHIVRNPNWDPKTDFRPAYLDTIDVSEGNQDAALAARRALSGSGLSCCDSSTLPVEVVRSALARDKSQIALFPSRIDDWVALNSAVKPFGNRNVRRALMAAVDRSALRLTRGGALLGDLATGFLPPGLSGFDEAGGLHQGTDFDFNTHPTGDPGVAKKYMLAARKEGLPIDASGRWTGKDPIVAVAPNSAPDDKTAQAFQAQAQKLGLNVTLRLVPREVVYTNFCSVPAKKVGICFVGFGSDTADPYSIMTAAFLGSSIRAQGNLNISQLNDPAVNAAIEKAANLPVDQGRNAAWGKVNDLIVGQAAAIPYLWPKAVLASSRDVQLIPNAYLTLPDLSYTSLKSAGK
jgi:peptide/nickel transport system substrate-binding protein